MLFSASKRNAVGKCSVAGHGNHILRPSGQIARNRHAQGRRKCGACVPGSVAIVLALGAQHESVQAAGLAHGLKTVEPPGKNLVDISLMADVEQYLVFGSIEHRVQSQCKFNHAKVRAQMAAGL